MDSMCSGLWLLLLDSSHLLGVTDYLVASLSKNESFIECILINIEKLLIFLRMAPVFTFKAKSQIIRCLRCSPDFNKYKTRGRYERGKPS